VIKAMSDRIYGERKAGLLPLARACGRLDQVLFVNRGNSLVQSREGTYRYTETSSEAQRMFWWRTRSIHRKPKSMSHQSRSMNR